MYNYSRLCQVWKAYEKGVIENYYEPLPDIGSVNFGLLTSKVSYVILWWHQSRVLECFDHIVGSSGLFFCSYKNII